MLKKYNIFIFLAVGAFCYITFLYLEALSSCDLETNNSGILESEFKSSAVTTERHQSASHLAENTTKSKDSTLDCTFVQFTHPQGHVCGQDEQLEENGANLETCKQNCLYHPACKLIYFQPASVRLKEHTPWCHMYKSCDHSQKPSLLGTLYRKECPEGTVAATNEQGTKCVPKYFPDHALTLEELELCDPHISIADWFYRCTDDKTCKKCINNQRWIMPKTAEIKTAIAQNEAKMKKQFVEMLSAKNIHPGDSVVIMVINRGYWYQFSNWACSTIKNGIDSKRMTILVAFDKTTHERAKKHGYMSYLLDWYKIDENAAYKFSRGPHFYIMALEHYVRGTLILMGYNVLFQDSDIIWKQNPITWLENNNKDVDIQMSYDGRGDAVGPANVGVIYVRSNCRTRIYIKTLIKHLELFIWTLSSQVYINTMIHHRRFRQMSFKVINELLFINGDSWREEWAPKGFEAMKPVLMHVSWTDSHIDKIKKWKIVDGWYLRPQCPLFEPSIFTTQVCETIRDTYNISKLGDCGKSKAAND